MEQTKPATSISRQRFLKQLEHTPLPSVQKRVAKQHKHLDDALSLSTPALLRRLAQLDGEAHRAEPRHETVTQRVNVSNSDRGDDDSAFQRPLRTIVNVANEKNENSTFNGFRSVESKRRAKVIQAPRFCVLEPSSRIGPPLATVPRFRDIDNSACIPAKVSSFVDEPLPDIRTQAARLRRCRAAEVSKAANRLPVTLRGDDLLTPPRKPAPPAEAFVVNNNNTVTPHRASDRFEFVAPPRSAPRATKAPKSFRQIESETA